MEFHLGVLLILGIAVFGGILSAWMVQKFHIPQVLGYILIGLIIGETGLQIVNHHNIAKFSNFNFFALGLIGFLVGSELRFQTLKKYGKQLSAILIGEGLVSFLLVFIPITWIIFKVSGNMASALATGIVFGAIASATDPASTIDVLWEYRCKGLLTTTIISIVALDDALAMTLYGLGTSTARILTGNSVSIVGQIFHTGLELFGAMSLGGVAGFLVTVLLRKSLINYEKVYVFAISLLLLLGGIISYLDWDIILASMSFGLIVTNMAPDRSKKLIQAVKHFSLPIYIVFFVLVGAKLSLSSMPGWLWAIIIFYVIGRCIGKVAGSYIGGRITQSAPEVQKYVGIGLFAQGGVAVGLSIMASHHLGSISLTPVLSLGDVIIFGVTATTFIAQLIGPPFTMLAAKWSGETGKNVTEEDIMAGWKVHQVMDPDIEVISENTPVQSIIQKISDSSRLLYPVVTQEGVLSGILSLENLKEILSDTSSWEWMVAADVMQPVNHPITGATPLHQAFSIMRQIDADQAVVLDENQFPTGIIDTRKVRRKIEEHIISLHTD